MTVTTTTDLPVVSAPDDLDSGAVAGATRLERVRRLPALRALRDQSLTGAGGVLVAVVVATPGVLVDLRTDATVGLPTTMSFVLAVMMTALCVHRRSLGTAVVLPPLLYAGCVAALAALSGNNEGSRELVLDTGTTLALSAPVLFGGTGLALVLVLVRLGWSLARR